MKRRTTPTLKVRVNFNHNQVDTIDFIFKQTREEQTAPLIKKTYDSDTSITSDVGYDSYNDIYLITFTAEETDKFISGEAFFMDTRIVNKQGSIPATKIVKLYMYDTLFNQDYSAS